MQLFTAGKQQPQISFLRWMLAVIVVIFLFSIFTEHAHAATTVKGLTVTPVRTEVSINPGTVNHGTISTTNTTEKPMNVTLTAEAFSVINEKYDYEFNVDAEIADWVTFEQPVLVLAPNETKVIDYDIAVPSDAEPGGRYISLFASNDTDIDQAGISARQRVASLLYITVNGELSRSGHLVSLTSPFIIADESNWYASLQNTGTTHFRSLYNVSLEHIIGGRVISNTSGSALVLPGTVRAIQGLLPLPTYPGIYKLSYTIGMGDSPAALETRYIIYAPPLFLVLLLTLIVVMTLLVIYIRLYNKHHPKKH